MSTVVIGSGKFVRALVVTPMLPRHVPLVAEIERESHPDPWPEKAFFEELHLPQSRMLVATCTLHPRDLPQNENLPLPGPRAPRNLFLEAILGYICLWHVVDEIHILNVTVRAVYRGRGIGMHLLRHSLKSAAQMGARIAVLEVSETNTAAQALYRKAGFEAVGKRTGYYGATKESALLMQKDLSARPVP